jgi:hypothetical protein
MPLRKTTRQFIPTPSLGPGRQSTEGPLVWHPPPDALLGLPQAVLWPPPVSQSAGPSQKAAPASGHRLLRWVFQGATTTPPTSKIWQ